MKNTTSSTESTEQNAKPLEIQCVANLSLRQYYAGLAMQGMLAAAENYPTPELALYAFQVADAMIAEGSK